MSRNELNPAEWPKVTVYGEPLTAHSWEIFPTKNDPRLKSTQRALLQRVFRLFQGLDILVVGELVTRTFDELKKYRGMGQNAVDLICLYLERNNLSLGTTIGKPAKLGMIEGAARRDKLPVLEDFLTNALNMSDVSDVLQSLSNGYAKGVEGSMVPASISETYQFQLYTREDLLGFEGMKAEWVNLIEDALPDLRAPLRF